MQTERRDAYEAFRHHRHDVMNGLQLVKSYIQIGKPERALQAVNDLADWLHTLSLVQMHPLSDALLWTVAKCPRLRIVSLPEGPVPVGDAAEELCRFLFAIDNAAAAAGETAVQVAIANPDGPAQTPAIRVSLRLREDLRNSWHNVHSEPWKHLLLDIEWYSSQR